MKARRTRCAKTSFTFSTTISTICSFSAATSCIGWISATSSSSTSRPARTSPSPPCRWAGARRIRSASCKLTTSTASRASWKSRRKPPCSIPSSCTPEVQAKLGIKGGGESFLASMGIYVFNRKVIRDCWTTPSPISASTSSPTPSRHAPRFLLRFSGLLGGHRHHPLLFRGEPRPRLRTAALQFLRHERADFHPPALSCPAPRSTARRLTTPSFPTAASSTTRASPTALSACAPSSAPARN